MIKEIKKKIINIVLIVLSSFLLVFNQDSLFNKSIKISLTFFSMSFKYML